MNDTTLRPNGYAASPRRSRERVDIRRPVDTGTLREVSWDFSGPISFSLRKREIYRTDNRRHVHPAIRERFERLKAEWESATGSLSIVFPEFMHPAYLQIIGMGKDVIPLLLDEVGRQEGHWFLALRATTGAAPAQGGDSYRIACEKWVRWGQDNGYI
jgi:hypothetical protein